MSAATHGVSVSAAQLHATGAQMSGAPQLWLRAMLSASTGARSSRSVGRGMEYDHSRAYVAGDDIRTMDWRLMARTGEPHTKQFVRQRSRNTILAIDLSASMFFGTRYSLKSWTACQLAAQLGWLATMAGDQLGYIVAAGQRRRFRSAGTTRQALAVLFRWLAEDGNRPLPVRPAAGQLNAMLRELTIRQRAPANILLISDFLALDQHSTTQLGKLLGQHRLSAFWVSDQTELAAWQPGWYPVQSGGGVSALDTRRREVADELAERQRRHRRRIESLAQRYGLPLHAISCNCDVREQLFDRARAP